MGTVITMTAWRRPDHLRQVLRALSECWGVDNYPIILSIDGDDLHGPSQPCIETAEEFSDTLDLAIISHPRNLGCAGNTGFVLQRAFETYQADRIIHLEEDTVPAPDFLSWMEWALREFEDDLDIWSVAGYHRRAPEDDDSPRGEKGHGDVSAYGIRDTFTCWGWGFWRRCWGVIEEVDGWFGCEWNARGRLVDWGADDAPRGEDFFDYIRVDRRGSWAWPMNRVHRGETMEVYPDVSRIQNIGRDHGKFNPGGDWHDRHQHTPYWTGDGEHLLPEEPDFRRLDQ